MERQIIITGDIIKEKAQFFWMNLSVYKEKEMPTFSNGWLQNFQSQQLIKSRTQHGEAGSAPQDSANAMIAIRQALGAYSSKDVFNCDETTLFWKMVPDCSLSTQSLPR